MLVLVAFTREPHLTVDLLVLEHVHDVVEQFPAVATNQDVWIAWRQKLFLFLLTPFNKSQSTPSLPLLVSSKANYYS